MGCDTHTHCHPLLEEDLCCSPGPRPEKNNKSPLRLTSIIFQDFCRFRIQIVQVRFILAIIFSIYALILVI